MAPRTVLSPTARAEEALAVCDRKLAKATARRDRLTTELDAAKAEVELLDRERVYLAASPHLPQVEAVDETTTVGLTTEQAAAATAIPTPEPVIGSGA